MICKYCGKDNMPERAELGIDYCKNCVGEGLRHSRKQIDLVCGHKAGYQPMFIDDVSTMANNPKRSY